jgi:hypothetical protein
MNNETIHFVRSLVKTLGRAKAREIFNKFVNDTDTNIAEFGGICIQILGGVR